MSKDIIGIVIDKDLIAKRRAELAKNRKGSGEIGVSSRAMQPSTPAPKTPPGIPIMLAGVRLKKTVESALATIQTHPDNKNKRFDDLLIEAIGDLAKKYDSRVTLDEL